MSHDRRQSKKLAHAVHARLDNERPRMYLSEDHATRLNICSRTGDLRTGCRERAVGHAAGKFRASTVFRTPKGNNARTNSAAVSQIPFVNKQSNGWITFIFMGVFSHRFYFRCGFDGSARAAIFKWSDARRFKIRSDGYLRSLAYELRPKFSKSY